MAAPAPPRQATPSFAAIAPVLDRLRELASDHLPDPHMVRVEGWQSGRFTAVAIHSTGRDADGRHTDERVRYDVDREVFIHETTAGPSVDDREAVEQTVIASFACPIDVPPDPHKNRS